MRIKQVLAVAAAAPILISASEPVRLKPASTWVLDYAEDSCRLIRKFGNPADPTILLFESSSPGSMSMLAIGNALRNSRGAAKIPARFLPIVDQEIEGESVRSAHTKKPAVLWAGVYLPPKTEMRNQLAEEALEQRPPPRDLAARAMERLEREAFAAKVAGIQIEARRKQPVVLETGSFGPALKMLEQCTRDQLTYWGVDPNLEDRIVRPVWAAATYRWFSSDDYPRISISRGEQSVVQFRLLVDATGKPTKCTSLSHFDAPAFQKVVCDILMKRARFEPAELADGTKVPSYYSSRIHWRME